MSRFDENKSFRLDFARETRAPWVDELKLTLDVFAVNPTVFVSLEMDGGVSESLIRSTPGRCPSWRATSWTRLDPGGRSPALADARNRLVGSEKGSGVSESSIRSTPGRAQV